MKAITVMQPWATLIALGIKTIETRPAPPNGNMRPDGVRGLPGLRIDRGERIAIHAGSSRVISVPGWRVYRFGAGRDLMAPEGPTAELIDLPLGAVVATAVVADTLPIVRSCVASPNATEIHVIDDGRSPRLWIATTHNCSVARADCAEITQQAPFGDFTPGRWGWLLADVKPLPEPIPAKGKQGVWEWTR